MQWVFLVALVALALGLSIVWWTLSPARRRDRERERNARAGEPTEATPDDAQRDVDPR
jgi:hypothetical protein